MLADDAPSETEPEPEPKHEDAEATTSPTQGSLF